MIPAPARQEMLAFVDVEAAQSGSAREVSGGTTTALGTAKINWSRPLV